MNEYVINLKNIALNALQIKANLNSGRLCAVVKANAYGLGAVRVAHTLKSIVDYFAVARPDELFELRKNGIKNSVLVLGHLFEDEMKQVVSQRGEIQVNSIEMLRQISKIATEVRQIAFVHLAFDTGMHRFGFSIEQAEEIANEVLKLKNVCVKGVFSHLANASNKEFSNVQLKRLLSLRPFFSGAIFHIANSIACKYDDFKLDMVRVGLDLFLGKHPAIALKGRVVNVCLQTKGESCGYGFEYIAKETQKLATISMGYADGIPRKAAQNAKILIAGEMFEIVSVCMDCSIVAVPLNFNVNIGDQVIVFGKAGKNYINIVDFANNCDTISYEILLGVSNRVKRRYLFR